MTDKEYKKLSIAEFSRAAEQNDLVVLPGYAGSQRGLEHLRLSRTGVL